MKRSVLYAAAMMAVTGVMMWHNPMISHAEPVQEEAVQISEVLLVPSEEEVLAQSGPDAEIQKALAEAALSPQVGDVLLGEAEVFDIVDDLLQTGRDGEAASIGYIAEEDIEVADLVGIAIGLKVAVAHGQFVKITQECVVHVFLHLFHNLYRFSTVIWRASITSRPLAWSAGSGPAVQAASTTISASGRAALTMMALESTQR